MERKQPTRGGPSARKAGRSTADRIAEITDLRTRLEAFAGDLTDEDLAGIVARFDGYSPRNAQLIAMQRPDATDVRGYRAWQAEGRQVRKGEKGIAILAPIVSKAQQDAEQKAAENDEQTLTRMRCKVTYVFDVGQTDAVEEGVA